MAFNLADLTTSEWRSRKLGVFNKLMATRAARVSPEHVQALNMIDLVFYGTHVFGIHRRSKSERAVLDTWHEYHDHLGIKVDNNALPVWNTKAAELFTNLMFAIAQDVNYKFDRVQLKNSIYSPQAHENLELEQTMVRKLVLKVLSGESALKMDVASFPVDEEAVKLQSLTSKALSEALSKGTLNVTVKREKPAA